MIIDNPKYVAVIEDFGRDGIQIEEYDDGEESVLELTVTRDGAKRYPFVELTREDVVYLMQKFDEWLDRTYDSAKDHD